MTKTNRGFELIYETPGALVQKKSNCDVPGQFFKDGEVKKPDGGQ